MSEPLSSCGGPAATFDPKLHHLKPVVILTPLSAAELLCLHSGSKWAHLPVLALEIVCKMLSVQDVVAVGQTCHGWRIGAKLASVWSKRQVSYEYLDQKPAAYGWPQKHSKAKMFARIIRFAPCLNVLTCMFSLKPAAKKAISTQSKGLLVRSAELNGQLVWVGKFMERQKDHLEELHLRNPSLQNLMLALTLSRLFSLTLSYKWSEYLTDYVHVPTLPSTCQGCPSLKTLICHKSIFGSTVDALLMQLADSLEDVSVQCFPSAAALQQCTLLRRLTISVNPAVPMNQQILRNALLGRCLDTLTFHRNSPSHGREPCVLLRKSLEDQHLATSCICDFCANMPTYRSSFVYYNEDEEGYDYYG